MHPINKLLSYTGWQLYRSSRQGKMPAEFRRAYNKELLSLLKNPPEGFNVYPELMYETGAHPQTYVDYECEFAARHIKALNPASILDIGSYRWFILGLLAHYSVTTLDVRTRNPHLEGEHVLTGDAKRVPLADGTIETVVSLCALEHFGLGRYGDDIDIDADKKALCEMARVLKPGGHIILTTEITRGDAHIAFNAHRIYTREMLHELFQKNGLSIIEEDYFSRERGRSVSLNEVTKQAPKEHDVYLVLLKKQS